MTTATVTPKHLTASAKAEIEQASDLIARAESTVTELAKHQITEGAAYFAHQALEQARKALDEALDEMYSAARYCDNDDE